MRARLTSRGRFVRAGLCRSMDWNTRKSDNFQKEYDDYLKNYPQEAIQYINPDILEGFPEETYEKSPQYSRVYS